MTNLDPRKYGYLWTDQDVNFIFVSCYLFREFRQRDFVLIYNPHENGVSFYLGNKERQRLARYGLRFYSKLYPEWEKNAKKKVAKARRFLDKFKKVI